jgi:hypothetical protein
MRLAVSGAMRTLHFFFGAIILSVAAQSGAAESCAPSADTSTRPSFDASLLKEGRFVYRTTLKGEFLGETALEVRRSGTTYRITMSAPKVGQSWEAVVDRSFTPLSAQLAMRTRTGPYEMNLKYAGAHVTGEERRGGTVTPVKAQLDGVVLDQRVDWASVMALTAPRQGTLALHVFDPSSGASQMLGRIGAEQPLAGSWGDATALRLDYTICKREHVEEYTVYATRETPRYMLREDMPNGLVSELIRVEPLSTRD